MKWKKKKIHVSSQATWLLFVVLTYISVMIIYASKQNAIQELTACLILSILLLVSSIISASMLQKIHHNLKTGGSRHWYRKRVIVWLIITIGLLVINNMLLILI